MSKVVKFFTFMLAAVFACAAVAESVSFAYQGVLKNDAGGNLTKLNQTLEFRLYDSPAGTDVLWGRAIAVLLDANGLFSVELSDDNGSRLEGSCATLKDAFLKTAGRNLYIGLSGARTNVDAGFDEIRPRQRILSVPFASIAGDVSTVSSNLTVKGTVDSKAVVAKTLKATENVEMGKNLTVNGTVNAGGGLTVVSGGATVAGKVTLNGATEINSSLKVKNDINCTNGSFKRNGIDIAPPVGMIVMWWGPVNNIPEGWALCNGENNTPDLRDRFIVGAGGTYAVGDKGGVNTVKLTEAQIPAHSHTVAFNARGYAAVINNDNEALWSNSSANAQNKTTGKTGSGAAHENRPPYYALCFIMRVK